MEQPTREFRVSGEQTMGESETGREPEVYTEMPKMHIELVPSGVVEVTPLRVDDSSLRTRPDALGVRGTASSPWGKGYSRKKMMGKKGTVEFVGSSTEE